MGTTEAFSWHSWSKQSWQRHLDGRTGLELSDLRLSLAARAWQTAERYGDKQAVSIDGHGTTFGQLRDVAAVVAGWLGGQLRVGDRVILVAQTSPGWVEFYLGALTGGVVVVLANPSSSSFELEHLVADSEAGLVVFDQSSSEACADLATPAVSLLDRPWASADPVAGPVESLSGSDVALLAYTSGTTGKPKGVPLHNTHLLSSICAATFAWRWSADDVVVHSLPLYHQHGLGALHAALCTGSSVALLSHFDAAELAATARTAGATVLFAVPAVYRRLVDQIDELPTADADAMRGLRLRICGSAPLDDDLAADVARCLGAAAVVRYGLTESGLNVSQTLDDNPPGTVGVPLPWVELRLVHDGHEVGPGAEGEIQLRGPQVFTGYWRNREATAEALDADGWFGTGDIGILDSSDGQLRIAGRSKELIITGGLNVYPREVELALESFPGVVEAGVAGVPDPRWGEQVTAWVVTEPGVQLDPTELLAHARSRLAPYKCPKQVHFVSELPRTPMGKLQRARLVPPTVAEQPT